MKKKNFVLPLIAFLLLGLFAFKTPYLDKDYWFEYITNHFNEYVSKYPQQKVYLQLDRDEYETGSTIWYKAYVLNDTDKKPETRSKNLYIELISPTKEVFMHRLLKIENGTANGDFPVLDTIATGMYCIRAYTANMKNFGKEYLFNKSIRINHAEKVYYSKEFHKKAKKVARKDDELDLQFFPEGGDFVDGLETVLAFKAINQKGKSVDVKGQIFTKKGTLVGEFETSHLGMGKIDFKPVYDEKYYAIVKTEKGGKLKFDLPEVLEKGYQLNVDASGNQIKVNIKTNKEFGNDPVAKTVYLFVQNGGKIYSSGKHQFQSSEINLNIGKANFPTGVLHFTLFDGQGQPQCERLTFVDHQEHLDIKPNNEIHTVGKRGGVEFDIEVTDGENPVEAELSVAVKNKSQTDLGTSSINIRNYMLLQADLRGFIEEPDYYFGNTSQKQKDLDLLMLTQGWRKFVWSDIMKDSIAEPEFPVEKDIRITGRITKYFLDISVKDATVRLTLLNKFNDVFTDITRNKGRFEFKNLDYADTLDVLIEARTKWNRKNVLILLDEDRVLGSDFDAFTDFYLDSLKVRRKIEHEPYKEPEPDPNVPQDFKLHDRADNVVYFDDPSFSSYSSVMDALKGRVPGLSVGNNGTQLRGPSSIMLSNEPLYLVDGVETDFNGANSINVNDVERVEILKGPSAAIYGMRAANGVIAIYTKRGFFYKRGEIRFKMLGYHTPKKFYSPKYQATNSDNGAPDLRKTVYWNPKVKTDKNGKAHIRFFQSDIVDDFEIVIEGMDNKGTFGYKKIEYSVSDVN